MDPQSLSFTPQSDIWRLSNTMRSFQEVQQDHADRLIRLERRQEDDARLKSVWGSASPFPGVLSGTPQQGPMNQPSGVDFTSFDDDQSNNMVRSLHLDADEEPRRFGVGSRANSVRFVDENSKSGQWMHASRSSIDPVPRSSSGLGSIGGHPLFERTISHKSDGRQSSAGQSAVSGRANSFLLDNSHLLASVSTEPPGLAPGLFILGSVPAIMRCWLSTNFKHETLLYAAVCTGSYKSYLDARLVNNLGLSTSIRQDLSGDRKVRVSMYLPEAVPQTTSSRSSSPAPHLPALTVDFTVLDAIPEENSSKVIPIIVGSDTLRAHNADILFSSNSMTIFDDERCKLLIPFVRPENDETFKGLITSATPIVPKFRPGLFLDTKSNFTMLANGTMDQHHYENFDINPAPLVGNSAGEIQAAKSTVNETVRTQVTVPAEAADAVESGYKQDGKPSSMTSTSSKLETKEVAEDNTQISSFSRTNSSPAIWGNWRRDGNLSSPGDLTSAPRNATPNYQRTNREQGIKVLKPIRQTSRTSAVPLPASPNVTGQSRFFDDGKRRSATPNALDLGEPQQSQGKRSSSGEALKPVTKDILVLSTPTNTSTHAPAAGVKSRSTNPIGGASAFGWLNSGVQPK